MPKNYNKLADMNGKYMCERDRGLVRFAGAPENIPERID